MAKLKKIIQEGEFAVGDAVLVGSTQEPGTIKFIGVAQFSLGEWVGVELDNPLGKNDGTVKDVKYFDCKPKHGIFVRRTALLRPKQAEAVVKESKEKEQKRTKQAKALMSGLKSGEVAQIVDKMEDQVASASSNIEHTQSNSISPSSPKVGKPEAPPRSPRSPSAPPKLSKPRSVKASGASGEQDEAAISALKVLRQAAEDQNPEALRTALLLAESKGVSAEEISSAHRMLAFQSQKALCKDIDKVRGVVGGLAEVVRQTEEKAKAIEDSAKNTNTGDWMNGLVKRIESRLWEGLEKKIDERIESTFLAVVQDILSNGGARGKLFEQLSQTFMSDRSSISACDTDAVSTPIKAVKQESGNAAQNAAATKIQAVWRRRMARLRVSDDTRSFSMIVKAARQRNEACAGIFDAACAKSKTVALSREDFHTAILEVHPTLAQGQTNILFKGYTAGTGRNDIDLVGFIGICEAVAIGDRAAAEFADVSVETFQSVGKAGGAEAAVKIQCAQRQRVARAEVSLRAEAKQAASPVATNTASIDEDKKPLLKESGNDSVSGNDKSVKPRRWRYSEEQAAIMIQRWLRRRLAGIKGDPLAVSIKRVKLRHAAWCEAYSGVCSTSSGLDENRFAEAMEIAIPSTLSVAQKQVLFQGYTQGTGQNFVDMVSFCAIALAVAAGDEVAAQYADMDLYTFQGLGENICG